MSHPFNIEKFQAPIKKDAVQKHIQDNLVFYEEVIKKTSFDFAFLMPSIEHLSEKDKAQFWHYFSDAIKALDNKKHSEHIRELKKKIVCRGVSNAIYTMKVIVVVVAVIGVIYACLKLNIFA